MPIYDDPVGALPPMSPYDVPDLSALPWPWDPAPAPPVPEVVAGAPEPAPVVAPPPSIPPPVDVALAGSPAFAAAPAQDVAPLSPPMQPEPAPDAITGVAPMTVADYVGQPRIETSMERYSEDPLANPDQGESQAYLSWLAQNDPGKFAEVSLKHAADVQKFHDERRDKIRADDHAAEIANLNRRRAADEKTRAEIASLQADAKRIAETKIDPSGGVHGINLVAGVLAAVIGGLVQSRHGGRNVGLDAVNDAINRGIDAQKADLVNQRESIGHRNSTLGQELARHGDAYLADEAVRMAALKQADDLLATEEQNYARGGTTQLRIAATRAGIAQQQQQGLALAQQKRFENNLKLAEFADKEAERAAKDRQHQQDQALGWSRLGFDQRKDVADRALRKEELGVKRDEVAATRDLKRTETERELSLGTPVPRLKLDDKGAPVIGQDGKPVTEAGELRQRDGSLFLAPDKEAHKDLAEKTLAASEINDIINEVLAIRDRSGGESATANSDDFQRLKVLQNELTIRKKAGTQGMSSDEDMKRIEASLGADDIASFRARAAGLEAGRDRTTAALNKAYRIAKYSGPKIEFPNLYGKAAANTPEDDRDQALLEKPGEPIGEAFKQEVRRRTVDLSPDELRAFGDPTAVDAIAQPGAPGQPALLGRLSPQQRAVYDDVRAKYDPSASPGQQQRIAELAAAAAGSGEPAMAARKLLQKAATQAHTARLRELAGAALAGVINADTLGGGEPERVR